MRRAIAILPAGSWRQDEAIDRITLDYDRRHRRRLRFTTAAGTEVLLDLKDAAHMRAGDAMQLEDGGCIAVQAAPEPLLEVTAADADALARLAWHLGNRHLAVQFLPGRLRILHDHVIARMLADLGAGTCDLEAPFDPESGAYHEH